MITEPFELNGKTIKDCHMESNNQELVFEFTDGSKTKITIGLTMPSTSFYDYYDQPLDESDINTILKIENSI